MSSKTPKSGDNEMGENNGSPDSGSVNEGANLPPQADETPGVMMGSPELIHDNDGPHDVMQLAATLERTAKDGVMAGNEDKNVGVLGHPELIHDNVGPHDVMQLAATLERTAKKRVVAENTDKNAAGSLDQIDTECEPFHLSTMEEDIATTKILAEDEGLNHNTVFQHQSDFQDQQRMTVELTPPSYPFNPPAVERYNIYEEEGKRQSSLEDEKVEEDRMDIGGTNDFDVMERGDTSSVHITEAWAVRETVDEESREAFIASHVEPILPWYEQKQSRLYTWALLCFFSAIALTTYLTNPNYNPNAYWHHPFTAWCSISLSSSALVSLIHLSGDNVISRRFVGTILEAILSLILAFFWFIAIWVIMTAPNELAAMWVDGVMVIKDANLFFSSWGAVICTGINFALYLKKWQRAISDCIRRSCIRTLSAPRGMGMGYTIRWSLLALASGVVLVLSVGVKCVVCYPGTCNGWTITSPEGTGDDATCARNEYGIINGSIGLAVSILTALLSYLGQDSPRTTTTIGFFMTVNYVICTAMLCFGMGPANYIGNQYLSAWSGVFLSLHLFCGGLKEYLKERSSGIVETLVDVAQDEDA